MNQDILRAPILLSFVFLFLLSSCATIPPPSQKDGLLAYAARPDETIIRRHLPVFFVENPNEKYNLIGTPSARINRAGKEEIFVDPEIPTIYTETRRFATAKNSYTNLIYRIHFEKIPFSLVPFYLGSGNNVGIIVVITLNSDNEPILCTTVQTCGCYLAFVPTSYLPEDAYPDHWNTAGQTVYSEHLPGLLDFKVSPLAQTITTILIKTGDHRVKDIALSNLDSILEHQTVLAQIQPLSALGSLPLGNGGSTSFFDNLAQREGYVKGSHKPWERILMSWWAFDWRLGEDKQLGGDKDDRPVFYTSLKPWARNDSDMRNFPTFLDYWGWKL